MVADSVAGLKSVRVEEKEAVADRVVGLVADQVEEKELQWWLTVWLAWSRLG